MEFIIKLLFLFLILALPSQASPLQAKVEVSQYQHIGIIGIQFVQNWSNYLDIVRVFKNGPASLAGLQEGDKIIGIDGKRINSFDPDMILGKPGTNVQLYIQREIKHKLQLYSVNIIRKDYTEIKNKELHNEMFLEGY